ncbi:hypothetical protein H310_11397 [Aphanomyces invadans]|uniref:Uncharacterized protein n=1 Tax=Aphanomyces invadans TaxID=157072 RepID=A0A024TM62_9STRA|nr:hypothetical protein H310_11397 [Aphanomyces invadans]ETV95128.1 hypothetical protein H310_11397 [Aphanomyces invadans]|eukprot:XP_008876301.1 hypothetical protein H310_11397 [Aphanomyces invadans]
MVAHHRHFNIFPAMKFLAGLVHVAVASQIVFDTHTPPEGAHSDYITDKLGEAVRFRSPQHDECGAPEERTVDRVTFWMDTSTVAHNTKLRVAICPSVDGTELPCWGHCNGGLMVDYRRSGLPRFQQI